MTTGSGVRWVSAKGRTQLHVVSKVEEGYWPMNTTPCCYSNNTGWKLRQGGWQWLWWPLSAAVVISPFVMLMKLCCVLPDRVVSLSGSESVGACAHTVIRVKDTHSHIIT